MVKSARSKALAKKKQNRARYVQDANGKKKLSVKWAIVRSVFTLLILFNKSRCKNRHTNVNPDLIECPVPIDYFLLKNGFFENGNSASTISFDDVHYDGDLNGRYESTTVGDGVVSVRTHVSNASVIKDVLNDVCKKVCRLVSWRKHAEKYKQNAELREGKKEAEKISYCCNNEKRTRRLTKKMQAYHFDNEAKLKKIQAQKDVYQTNERVRRQKCTQLRDRYQTMEKVRRQKCTQLRDRYQTMEKVRQQKCTQLQDRYQTMEKVRRQKCTQLRDRYQTRENVRRQKCTQLQDRYQKNESVRQRICKRVRKRYEENDVARERKNTTDRALYAHWYKRQHKLFLLRQKYRENLRVLEDKARELLDQHGSTDGQMNTTEFAKHLKETKMNQRKLYATMAKQVREKYLMQGREKKRKLDFYENEFHNYIHQMPKYVCTICHRSMFQSDVRLCDREKYKLKCGERNWSSIESCFSGTYVDEFAFEAAQRVEWICNSCHTIIWKGEVPTRSVYTNKLDGGHLPDEIRILNELERHLIALRLPFMKMISLPKGGQKGCKGPVICVPSEVQNTANVLPRHPSKSAFIRLKLKRRLNYRGWYKYQTICPDHVRSALRILREINDNYKDIQIDDNDYDYFHWDDALMTELGATRERQSNLVKDHNQIENETEQEAEEVCGDEEDDEIDPRKKFSILTDTCLQSNMPEDYVDFEHDEISVAPAEKNRPASLFREKQLEAKAFPHLFPTGKNTFDEKRDQTIKLGMYANSRLFSADFRYASDPHYIFFLQYLNDIQHASSGISLQLRKSCSKSQFTAKKIVDKTHLSNLLKKDMIFKHLLKVRGSPQYWSTTLSDLFAMIRQLGVPTWFCSFSAADSRWIELLHYLADYHKMLRKNKYSWNETNFLLRSNPVIVARIFDRRFRGFMRNIILSQCAALGEVTDYFYRVEFQKRGSPHIHMVVWIKNAPKYGEASDEEISQFIDKYVTCRMPDEKKNPLLHEIIKNVQTHSKGHSKSCKRKDRVCRFFFPKPISRRTFIVDQKSHDVDKNDDEVKKFDQAKAMLKDMNIYLKEKEDKENFLTWNHFEGALVKVGWTYDEYERALHIILAPNTVVLKRAPSDRWVNNYNEKCIVNWNANMDVQFVMNAYACGKYMLSYICKAEKEMSDILKNAHEEAKGKNLSIQEEMKVLSGVYFQHREVCVQEAIYRVCGLHLKRGSRKVEFIPSDPDCFRLSKPLSVIMKMIAEGKEDDENLLCTNFVEKYLDRPDDPVFNICLADFVAKFRIIKKNPVKSRSSFRTWFLKTLKFGLRERKLDAVVRYPQFDMQQDEERFYHNLMRLFLPIRNENEILQPYSEFFHKGCIITSDGQQKSVKEIVMANRQRYESKISKQLEDAMKDIAENDIREDSWGILCAETELEREETASSVTRKYKAMSEFDEDDNPDLEHLLKSKKSKGAQQRNGYEIHPTKLESEIIKPMLKQLTEEQLNIFYYVRDWCLRKRADKTVDSLRLFTTGGAGTGKSHLLKCMFYEASKILNETVDGSCNEIRTLICAPTNAAALNMHCTTIHSTFKVGMKNSNLSENILNTIRSKLDGLTLLFIDEISLVNQALWRELHARLGQIMHESRSNTFFGNVSIVAVGDFYQLPPVKGIPLYLSISVVDYWQDLFEYSELTICQRTKEAEFYALANRIRKKKKIEPFSESDKKMLNRCVQRFNSKLYQDESLHLFAWNRFVDDHNERLLLQKCYDIVDVPARKVCGGGRTKTAMRERSTELGEHKKLRIAVGARVIIEENVNREDGIVKGAFGNIVQIICDSVEKRKVERLRIKFDNADCGLRHQSVCEICKREKTVCIERYNNPRDEDEKSRHVEQFPIRLGWASTVHKVQGLTIKEVIIDPRMFNNPGQGYASFTRPPSFNGVFMPELKEKAFFCDERIEESVTKMRKMEYQYAKLHENTLFRIAFHNVEGLETHIDDINNHQWYNKCNVVCIAETWLKTQNSLPNRSNFTFVGQSRSNSYRNSALCNRDRGGVGIYIRNDTDFQVLDSSCCDIECLTIRTRMCGENCFISTVYKPPNVKSKVFLTNLEEHLSFYHVKNEQHIIVGDFNENADLTRTPIRDYFANNGYKSLISGNTTIGDSSLDCIFVKQVILQYKTSIIPAYFSYHSALMLELLENDVESTMSDVIFDDLAIEPEKNSNQTISQSSLYSKGSNGKNILTKRKQSTEINDVAALCKKMRLSMGTEERNHSITTSHDMSPEEIDLAEKIRASYIDQYDVWYSFAQIHDLLEQSIQLNKTNLAATHRNVYNFTPISGTSIADEIFGAHNELLDAMVEFQCQRLLNTSYASVNEIILPVNVNRSHWILLVIVYAPHEGQDNQVFFFDSLGKRIPASVSHALFSSGVIQYEYQLISIVTTILQKDERNCGPWVVACATHWLQTRQIDITHFKSIDIERERRMQEAYLYDLYLARAIAQQQ